MSSQFEGKYSELMDSIAKIKSHYDEIDDKIQSLSSISNNDEIQSSMSEVNLILASVHDIINEYSETIDEISSAIELLEDADTKTREQQKLKEHLSSTHNSNLKCNQASLRTSLQKVKTRYDYRVQLTVDRLRVMISLGNSVPQTQSNQTMSGMNNPSPNNGDSSSSTHGQTATPFYHSNIAIPTLRIEPFDGHDLTQWSGYYYQIKSIILDNPRLSNAEKACYVRSSLKGAALALVASIPIGDNFLTLIMERLRAEYEDHATIQAKLLKSFMSIRSKSSKLTDQLDAVKSMISLAHTIDSKCGINSQLTQAQIVNNIHSRFIDRTFESEDQSMIQTLESIEKDLRTEIRRVELRSTISSMTQNSSTHSNDSAPKQSKPTPPSASQPPKPSTPSSTPRWTKASKNPMCVYCDKHEFSSSCTEVVSAKDRKKILTEKSLCYCCFSPTHVTKDCTKAPCQTCKGKHHKSICEKTSVSACINSNAPIQLRTRLFTAPVILANPEAHQSSMANVLLDTGSQLSLISSDLASRLKLTPVGTIEASISGLVDSKEHKPASSSHEVVRFELMTDKGKHTVQAVVRDTDSIVGSIQSQPLSESDLDTIRKTLNDIPNHLTQSSVCPDLLLGVSDSLKLLKDAKSTELPCGYELIQSVIGPFVAGASATSMMNQATHSPIPDKSRVQSINLKASSVISSLEETLEQKIERTFSVDPISRIYETTEKEARKEADNFVTDHFDRTVEHSPEGYVVRYALNEELVHELPSNHDLAVSRLSSTVKKLSKDPKLLQFYDSIIKDQIELNQVEHVDPSDSSGTIHYLAHQAVLRLDKATTPLRIVFDASAHLKNKPSLNDVIYPGPSDMEQIPSILIRSRSRRGLIIADVEKAFLQVKLSSSQRNMLRFIWLKDLSKPVCSQNLLYLRFTVTPFGVNQSPCLLSKVINHHIKHNSDDCNPTLVSQLISNIYVDNIIINVDDPMSDMYTQSKRLFGAMSMNLRDYASNIDSFMSSIHESDRAKDSRQKLLGLIWDTGTDQISVNIPHSKLNEKETRRTMLSTVSSPYDPLGLINPLVLPARITVQSLWNGDLGWDEEVDVRIRDTFHSQIEDVEKFSLPMNRYLHLSQSDTITLVAFADASMQAMAACVYCWTPKHPPSLVISKYKLAPIKSKSTIPKMELEAMLMAHALIEYTVVSLRKEFPTHQYEIYSYTDSAIVLHWLKPTFSKSVGTFVTNRVKNVHSIASKLSELNNLSYHSPRHVSSEYNPADHATRGLTSSEMSDPTHQWWVGPCWMQSPPDTWPNPKLSDMQCPLDDLQPKCNLITHEPVPDLVIDLSRHSSLVKAIKVTAYVYRFMSMCASKTRNTTIREQLSHIPIPSSDSLSAAEKRFALHNLIRIEQTMQLPVDKSLKRDSLIEDKSTGILRVVTRLTNCDQPIEFKCPIYIPTCANSTLARLLIQDVHCSSLHASTDIVLNSLKSKYVIPRARPLVKSVLRQCVPCRKTNNLPFKYPQSPPLPGDRVRRSIPFEHTGIDYIGPFQTVDQGKMWVVIYTCFSTRITHLETVSSMLPSSFLLSFRRFCSRRGSPIRITSDQGTTFKMASSLLSSVAQSDDINTLFSTMGITWSFTTAHSPWKGGVYERLIKVLKQSLSRSIGQKRLSKEELETVMCEAESLMNSRPMTYISSDEVGSFTGPVLRPIDLILPESFLGCHLNLLDRDDEYRPPDEENSSRETAIKQLTKSLSVIDKFWKRWSEEYLSTLRDSASSSDPLQSSRSSPIIPQVGSIVLVIDESGNTPRSTWKMARIVSLSDKAATLRSHAGRTIERPINLLIPLEINAQVDLMVEPEPAAPDITHQRVTSPIYSDAIMTDHSNIIDAEMEDKLLTEGATPIEQCTKKVMTLVTQTQDRISTEVADASEITSRELAEVREKLAEIQETQKKTLANQAEIQETQKKTLSAMSSLHSLVAKSFSQSSQSKPVTTTVEKQNKSPKPPPVDTESLMKFFQSFTQAPANTPGPTKTFPKKGRPETPKPYQRTDGKVPANVKCRFCDSPLHLTRNCFAVTSVAVRRRTIQRLNVCPRCFRPLNNSHHPSCKPDQCKKGCVDDQGKPLHHMDHLCPLNPSLTP